MHWHPYLTILIHLFSFIGLASIHNYTYPVISISCTDIHTLQYLYTVIFIFCTSLHTWQYLSTYFHLSDWHPYLTILIHLFSFIALASILNNTYPLNFIYRHWHPYLTKPIHLFSFIALASILNNTYPLIFIYRTGNHT